MVDEDQVDDVDVVARYLDARQAERAAQQRVGKLGDQLSAAYEPLRRFDADVDAAHRTMATVLQAEEIAAEKAEAVAMHRSSVIDRAALQEAARQSGAKGRQARERLVLAAKDRAVHHERVVEASGRLAQVAATLGSDDPAVWQQARAAAEGTLAGAPDRRQEVLQGVTAATGEVRQRIHAAQVDVERVTAEREAAERELQSRGLDADRIAEAALRVLDEHPQQPANPATEAALLAYRERDAQRVPAGELDEEPRSRPGPARGGPALGR